MSKQLKKQVRSLAKKYFADTVKIREHLHANPELSFQEYNTSKFICSRLKAWSIPYRTGYVRTGIVALIKGTAKDRNGSCISLRADMDALPILEQNKTSYCSRNKGVMHACGHDVHSASLLGAARILNDLKSEFSGTIKLIFQPGEEKAPGGASLMIKEGVLINPAPNKIFAQHVFPSLPAGKVGFRKGMYMASTDEIYLTVRGKGGHAAMKGTYVNPLIIASEIISALENKFSKKQRIPTVLAFGKILGAGATNVIPDLVEIEGTFRTMNEPWRAKSKSLIKSIATKTAVKYGGTCDVKIVQGYPALINDPHVTVSSKKMAEYFLGKNNVVDLPLRMTGEDFSFFAQKIPACFYRLGTAGNGKKFTSGVHTPTFDIDKRAIETGMGLLAWIALGHVRDL